MFRAYVWPALVAALIGVCVLTFTTAFGGEKHPTLDEVTVKVTIGQGHGTGVVVGDGTIVLTAAHVVAHSEDGNVLVVLQDGTAIDGYVAWVGVKHDIAIIKIDTVLPAAVLQCEQPPVGTALEIVGHPHVGDTLNWAHTFGHIVQFYDGLPNWPMPVMIFDASVFRGNSGGPIFNEDGEVIGIVNAMAGVAVGFGDVAPYGFNLGTPSSYICGLLP